MAIYSSQTSQTFHIMAHRKRVCTKKMTNPESQGDQRNSYNLWLKHARWEALMSAIHNILKHDVFKYFFIKIGKRVQACDFL